MYLGKRGQKKNISDIRNNLNFFLLTSYPNFFNTVTMGKGIMNSVCVVRYPLYIYGWCAWFAVPDFIPSGTRRYIELTLYPWIFRWIQELLIPYKTTYAHNYINNLYLITYERFNRLIPEKKIHTTYQMLYGDCQKSKHFFLISTQKSQV